MKKEDYDFQDVISIDCEKPFGENFYECTIKTLDGTKKIVHANEIISNGGDGMAVNTVKYEGGKIVGKKDYVSTWIFPDSTNTLFCNLIHGKTIECESKDLLHF